MNNDTTPTNATKSNTSTTLARGFLNILLVFLESAITLALRFDPQLRKLAYPLAEKSVVVCVRTYLPHTQFYATFGYRGVLLDDRLPPNKNTADITINAYSYQLITLLTNHSHNSVEALQIRGDSQTASELKEFLVRLGMGGVIQTILHKVKHTQQKPTAEEREQKQENYKAKITEQAERIDALIADNAKLNIMLKEAHSKQKATMLALIIACLIATIAIIINFI